MMRVALDVLACCNCLESMVTCKLLCASLSKPSNKTAQNCLESIQGYASDTV